MCRERERERERERDRERERERERKIWLSEVTKFSDSMNIGQFCNV